MNAEVSIENLGGVVKGHTTFSKTIVEADLDWQNRAIPSPEK
jgi:hypothetical protein